MIRFLLTGGLPILGALALILMVMWSGSADRTFIESLARLAITGAMLFLLPLLGYPLLRRALNKQSNSANSLAVVALVVVGAGAAWAITGVWGWSVWVIVILAGGGEAWWSYRCMSFWEKGRANSGYLE